MDGLPDENGNPVAGAGPQNGRSDTEGDHGNRHPAVIGKTPRCRCGETRPDRFAKKTSRGKVGWQHQCKACMVAAHRAWRAKPEGRAKMRAGVGASKARYPERTRARALLYAAVARGDVIPGPCYVAGCGGAVEGHHDDYSKPLEVTWSCRAHHRALDRARQGSA